MKHLIFLAITFFTFSSFSQYFEGEISYDVTNNHTRNLRPNGTIVEYYKNSSKLTKIEVISSGMNMSMSILEKNDSLYMLFPSKKTTVLIKENNYWLSDQTEVYKKGQLVLSKWLTDITNSKGDTLNVILESEQYDELGKVTKTQTLNKVTRKNIENSLFDIPETYTQYGYKGEVIKKGVKKKPKPIEKPNESIQVDTYHEEED